MADKNEPSVETSAFLTRLKRCVDAFAETSDPDVSLASVDSVLLVAGGQDEDNPYKKTTAFQTWLLGYEFPSTVILLSKDRITFLAGSSRTNILEKLHATIKADLKTEMRILTRSKDEKHNKELWEELAGQLKGRKVGHCPKDTFSGKFVTEWQSFEKSSSLAGSYESVDVSGSLAGIMVVKDEQEIISQTVGTRMTCRLMEFFSQQMATAVEQDERITHEKLAERVEQQLEQPTLWKDFVAGDGIKLDRTLSDWCYTPIIQSGGNFDLKSSAQSDDARLKAGVIYCSLGVRYKSYCCNVGRTFFVDPDTTQEENYLFLLGLQNYVFDQLKEGAVIKDVYNAAIAYVKGQKPDLEGHFLKNLGFAIGIEFRESAYVIGPKVTRKIKQDMILNVSLGFQSISDPKDKKKTYALCIIDTVRVGANGATPLSSDASKAKDDVMFYFQREDDKKSKVNGSATEKRSAPSATRGAAKSSVMKTRLRNEGKEVDDAASNRRTTHQDELAAKKQKEGLERYSQGAGAIDADEKKAWKRFESYQRESQLPESAADRRIHVDERRNTIILPINGFAVPFHINTLKSVVKQDESGGGYSTLRFMFVTPGQIAGKKEDTPFEDPEASFIRGFTFRSNDSARFAKLHEAITQLKRNMVKRENERKELADVVEQDNLMESRGRALTLRDTNLRPKLEGKQPIGDVEIHQNGIRWTATSGRSDHKVDILFSNIKHLFFQPCDNELIVLIHVTLKNPIIAGKKKVKEFQFFRDATEGFDETGNKKRRKAAMDEDEIENEQEERRQRARLNREFKAYAEKIVDAANKRFEVDVPFRELGFQGVPFRAASLLQPTTECLVQLTEWPPLIITLADVELVHLERVQFGLKNFDMSANSHASPYCLFLLVLLMESTDINTIPMGQLDNVKDWLDSCDILFSEGVRELKLFAIVLLTASTAGQLELAAKHTVKDDPNDFFAEGGWSFLRGDGGGDDGSSDEESSEEDAFNPDSSDMAEESSDDFSDDEEASQSSAGSEEPTDSGQEYGGSSESEDERKKKKGKKR